MPIFKRSFFIKLNLLSLGLLSQAAYVNCVAGLQHMRFFIIVRDEPALKCIIPNYFPYVAN